MKKIIPVFFTFLLLFTGCEVKNYTPEIPLTFKYNVKVTSGDFSYDCVVSKTESAVEVTVDSTAAKGMSMVYDGKTLTFSYADFSYDVNGANYEKRNPAVVIYEVFDHINSAGQLNAKKIDGGFKYEGKISLGNFTLLQGDNNTLLSISVREADYKIEFIS